MRNCSIKMQYKFIVVFVIVILSLNTSIAQEKTEVYSAEKISIKSDVLNEERVMSVFLPDDYGNSKNRYPVLFLLDGRTHFQHAIGAVNYLATRAIVPNLIIVSIHNVDRNRDFSPVHSERFPTSGGAEKFLNFMEKELKPYLDKTYRTSNYSVLMGHSFGGTFATYSLLTKPGLFDGYIAISPYLQYADNYVVKMAAEKLKSNYNKQKYYYMTLGDEPDYISPLKEFSFLVKEKSAKSVNFEYVKMEMENHGTIPYVSLFNGLRFVFSDWQLPPAKIKGGLVEVDNHFKSLSKKYDVKLETPENLINILGYRKLQVGDFDGAIGIFKENVRRYPNSANVYDSLGEAYEKNEQLELAKNNYQKACKIGEEKGDVNLAVYRKNLDRVKK